MLREVNLKECDVIGREITYHGQKVGHVVNIKDDTVRCIIDSDIVAHRIRDGKTTLSLEVIDV